MELILKSFKSKIYEESIIYFCDFNHDNKFV